MELWQVVWFIVLFILGVFALKSVEMSGMGVFFGVIGAFFIGVSLLPFSMVVEKFFHWKDSIPIERNHDTTEVEILENIEKIQEELKNLQEELENNKEIKEQTQETYVE